MTIFHRFKLWRQKERVTSKEIALNALHHEQDMLKKEQAALRQEATGLARQIELARINLMAEQHKLLELEAK